MNRFTMVGGFVIAGLALFTTGLFMIGNRHEAFARRMELYTEFAESAQRNIADHYQHCGWTMNHGTLRLALDHATKGRHYDTVEGEVVKAVVSSHTARHVGGIVKPLKKTLIIEIKCLASGMGRNPGWEDHAELSPSLTVLVVGLYFFDLNAGVSQQERDREVIPERVACEVEFLKFVPLRREDGTGE